MRKTWLVLAMLVPILFVGCVRQDGSAALTGEPLVVGSLVHASNIALSHIAMHVLEANGIPIVDNTRTGNFNAARAAMLEGEIDFVWSYTGTTWTGAMNQEAVPGDTAQDLLLRVREADLENGIIWLEMAPASIAPGAMMTRELSERLGIRTLSDLSEYQQTVGGLTFAGTPSSIGRLDGLLGLREYYGIDFDNVMPMVADMLFHAVASGHAHVSTAIIVDWRNLMYEMVFLDDDQSRFTPLHPAPVIRQDALERFPQIPDILNPIAERITLETLQRLNYELSHGAEPSETALSWLRAEGFVE